jgi:hypothetical protein
VGTGHHDVGLHVRSLLDAVDDDSGEEGGHTSTCVPQTIQNSAAEASPASPSSQMSQLDLDSCVEDDASARTPVVLASVHKQRQTTLPAERILKRRSEGSRPPAHLSAKPVAVRAAGEVPDSHNEQQMAGIQFLPFDCPQLHEARHGMDFRTAAMIRGCTVSSSHLLVARALYSMPSLCFLVWHTSQLCCVAVAVRRRCHRLPFMHHTA